MCPLYVLRSESASEQTADDNERRSHLYSRGKMLKSEAQFTRRITRVDADAKACASWKGKRTVLIFGQKAITQGFAECRTLCRRTARSSEHRSLRERLRPTGLAACLSRNRIVALATPIDATAIPAASLRGCRLTRKRWASRRQL